LPKQRSSAQGFTALIKSMCVNTLVVQTHACLRLGSTVIALNYTPSL